MISKKAINKSLKYLAVSLFVFAMVANIQITLTDPFMFTSEMVLAQDSGTDSSDSSDENVVTCYSTYKGTWIGGTMIFVCGTCIQERVKDYSDQGTCVK